MVIPQHPPHYRLNSVRLAASTCFTRRPATTGVFLAIHCQVPSGKCSRGCGSPGKIITIENACTPVDELASLPDPSV